MHRASGARCARSKNLCLRLPRLPPNQANSQLSTGPKSQAGKAAAARNNFRHGLSTSSEFWVLPSESQTEFNKLLAEFQQEHQPTTPTEEALVQAMAEHHWLRHRAMRLEESCFDYTTGQIIDDRNSLSTCATKPRTSAPFIKP